MAESFPTSSLEDCYSFPADSFTRAFIRPYIGFLCVYGDPEYVHIITRLVNYVSTEAEPIGLPPAESSCHGLQLVRQNGSLYLAEGTILDFGGAGVARITSMGSPYWRHDRKQYPFPDAFPDTHNILLSYLQLEFVDPASLDKWEIQRRHLLTPTDHYF